MAYSNKAQFGTVRKAAFGAITASYAAVGNPVSENVRIFYFGNSTDADISVSFDGTTENMIIAAASFQLYDFTANEVQDIGWWIPIGTVIYIKYLSVPTKGNFWIQETYGTFL